MGVAGAPEISLTGHQDFSSKSLIFLCLPLVSGISWKIIDFRCLPLVSAISGLKKLVFRDFLGRASGFLIKIDDFPLFTFSIKDFGSIW